jgi:hypothetical protein
MGYFTVTVTLACQWATALGRWLAISCIWQVQLKLTLCTQATMGCHPPHGLRRKARSCGGPFWGSMQYTSSLVGPGTGLLQLSCTGYRDAALHFRFCLILLALCAFVTTLGPADVSIKKAKQQLLRVWGRGYRGGGVGVGMWGWGVVFEGVGMSGQDRSSAVEGPHLMARRASQILGMKGSSGGAPAPAAAAARGETAASSCRGKTADERGRHTVLIRLRDCGFLLEGVKRF